jgi:hypothetical protein
MQFLGSVAHIVRRLVKRPVLATRRAKDGTILHRFDILEDRQLLSHVALLPHHAPVPGAHHHAIVDSRIKFSFSPQVTYYNAESTTDASELPVSGWQGIRASDTPGQYLITGTSKTAGLLYIGSIDGRGTSYAVNYPGAQNTSVYGPNNLGGGLFQLVGSYTPEDASGVDSFVFQGTTAGGSVTGKYRTIAYPAATYTYVHSTMGGLAVGNADGATRTGHELGPGTAFIYDLDTGKVVTDIQFPHSMSNTAYGIWYNGGTSYTIVGGFSNRAVNNMHDQSAPIGTAYMVDYNTAAGPRGRFSHWTSFKYPKGKNLLTHFQGISSPSPGLYIVAADSLQVGRAHIAQGAWVLVKRNPNGTFGSSNWLDLHYPNAAGFTSNDSVAGNQLVGFFTGNTGGLSLQATVSMAPRR